MAQVGHFNAQHAKAELMTQIRWINTLILKLTSASSALNKPAIAHRDQLPNAWIAKD